MQDPIRRHDGVNSKALSWFGTVALRRCWRASRRAGAWLRHILLGPHPGITSQYLLKAAVAKLQGQAVGLLLNNAGVGGARGQTIGNIDYAAWAKVLDVNTMGPMRVSEAFLDHVARSDRKLIVTVTSGMGSIADNSSGGSIAYRSSKAAVNMVVRSLAIDLAPRNITCVVVNPGWVQTEMGGPHATLTPAESVTRLRRLIDTLGPAQSGKFFNHDGREYAW